MKTDKRLRLWPAAIIIFLGAIALGIIWSLPSSHQERNIRTVIASFVIFVCLLVWFVLGSRAARGPRIAVLSLLVLSIFASWQFLEIRGVTGDLLPIIG